MEEPVLFSVEKQTAIITLNRPERRNAINQALLSRLYDAIEKVTTDVNIRAAIITGNGKSFCSGLDLEAIFTDNLFDPRGDGSDMPDLFAACKKPIIGAVNGHAITGGFELALNCDFLIASEQASFLDTHAKLGIHPGWGMTQLLQQAVGRRRARQISLTCKPVSAQKAYEWGLVNEIVPNDMLMSRAREIAEEMCSVNQDMLEVVRDLINYQDNAFLQESYAHERAGCSAFLRKHLKK